MEGGLVLFVADKEGHQPHLDALSGARCSVVHAVGLKEALHTLTTVWPDVVVAEIPFADPAVDAAGFIRELRARVDSAVSIVALSRYFRAADRASAHAAGADIFLMTPALPSALVFEVQRALILRRSGRRLSWNWPKHVATVARSPALERRRLAHS
jgi:CheY-like chemotaxis protein